VFISLCGFEQANLEERGCNYGKSKNTLYILAAIGVTIISAVTGLWLIWGVVITLMFIDSLVSNLKLWIDDKESRYLDVLQKPGSILWRALSCYVRCRRL
jgi:hypothetical protein